jgi:hypothetical protein
LGMVVKGQASQQRPKNNKQAGTAVERVHVWYPLYGGRGEKINVSPSP